MKVHLIEKGGKPRDATISKEYQTTVRDILKNKKVNEPIFNKYTKKIDNHALDENMLKIDIKNS